MKGEHEWKLNRTEISMIRWMCGVKLKERTKNEQLKKTLKIGTSQFDDQKDLVEMVWTCERKDDNDWVKRCITWEVEGIRHRGRPTKTWCDCVKIDTESLGLSQNRA